MMVLYWIRTFFSFVSCLWIYIFYLHVESLCFVRSLTNYIGLKLLIYISYTIYSGKIWVEDIDAEEGHTKFSQDWHFTWWKMKWQKRLWRMCTYMYSHIKNTPSDYCGDRSVQFCDLSPYFDIVLHVATCTKYNIPVLLLQIFSYGVIFVVLAIMCIAHQNVSHA